MSKTKHSAKSSLLSVFFYRIFFVCHSTNSFFRVPEIMWNSAKSRISVTRVCIEECCARLQGKDNLLVNIAGTEIVILVVPFESRNRPLLPIARPKQEIDLGLSTVPPPGHNVYSTKWNRWAQIFEKIACSSSSEFTQSRFQTNRSCVVQQICVVAEDGAPSSEHALVASPSHQHRHN